jgi:hypothetical protein
MKAVLDILSLAEAYNTRVLKDLRSLSDFLHLQQQLYKPISNGLTTYFCYETVETRLPCGISRLLVPFSSAVVEDASHAGSIAIPKDHAGISKFEGFADNAFMDLASALRTLVGDASKRQASEAYQQGHLEFTGNSVTTILRCDTKGMIAATPSFHGRTEALDLLSMCFNNKVSSVTLSHQCRFVLYGLGGAGKTQIVYRFIEHTGDRCVK